MFGELWTKDTIMTDMDRETEEEDFASHPLLVPTKKLYFQDKGSILKASRHTRKMDSTESQSYFKPRSNIKPKNKRGIFRKMAFKIYLQLSLPIAIQQVTENEAIKKTLEALTEIWKVFVSVNRHNIILS